MLINYGSCIVSLYSSSEELHILTFITNPETTTIDLLAPGYTQIGNTIAVPANSSVHCEAYKSGYVPYIEDIVVTETTTKTVNLEPGVLLTINPTPADALVEFTIDGHTYPVETNASEVPIGRPFTYTVSKENYETKSATITITEPTTLSITLKPFTPLDLSDYSFDIDSKHDVTLTEYIGNETDITVPVTNDNN